MKHLVSLSIALFVVWYLLSGFNQPLLLTLGGASTLFTLWIAQRMDVVDREGHPIHLGGRIFSYHLWLSWNIILANIQVAHAILRPRLAISPRQFRVKASQPGDLGKVIYANSITLTPGTVAMSVEGDEILVHALTQNAADELRGGKMDRRVAAMAGDT